ncbi:MAG TPA: hypothetical protein VLI69_00425 [Gammaproteobacteria bacterium]|nr:hypothetical protein [Gammaproteobacteria bacterium]
MLEIGFLPSILCDIFSTEAYTLQGVAKYIDYHEDVITHIIIGKNLSPSLILVKRLTELHRSIRPELYQAIMKKIFMKYE